MSFHGLISEIKQIIGRFLFHKYETRFIEKHYPSFNYIDFYCSEYDYIGEWRFYKKYNNESNGKSIEEYLKPHSVNIDINKEEIE